MGKTIPDYELREAGSHAPVPSDCPAYTLVTTKRGEWWHLDFVPYRNSDWCQRCSLFGNYCDGNICQPHIEGDVHYNWKTKRIEGEDNV